MKKIIYLFASIILMSSCVSEKTMLLTVASNKIDCQGVAPQKCMLIKKANSTDWERFYDNINGFNHEDGYEYVLEVKEEKLDNVPADASSLKYTLVKEISKEAKISDGLPIEEVKEENYECTGLVLSIEKEDIGRGAAAGKISASVVEIQVTTSVFSKAKPGDIIYCELIHSPKVMPVKGREYVFKAKHIHPAHAKGVYLLETDVMDLVR